MKKGILTLGISVAIFLASQAANAIPINEFSSLGQLPRAYFGGSNTFQFNYDFGTQFFSSVITGTSGFDSNGDTIADGHIVGSITTNAIVDHDGNLLSGNVTWNGGSTDAGITDGTLLLSANIVGLNVARDSSEYLPGTSLGSNPVFQLILENEESYAALDLADYLEFRMFLTWGGGPLPLNPFQSSFEGTAYTGSSIYNLERHQVPVPTTLYLTGSGLALLGFARHRKTRVSKQK